MRWHPQCFWGANLVVRLLRHILFAGAGFLALNVHANKPDCVHLLSLPRRIQTVPLEVVRDLKLAFAEELPHRGDHPEVQATLENLSAPDSSLLYSEWIEGEQAIRGRLLDITHNLPPGQYPSQQNRKRLMAHLMNQGINALASLAVIAASPWLFPNTAIPLPYYMMGWSLGVIGAVVLTAEPPMYEEPTARSAGVSSFVSGVSPNPRARMYRWSGRIGLSEGFDQKVIFSVFLFKCGPRIHCLLSVEKAGTKIRAAGSPPTEETEFGSTRQQRMAEYVPRTVDDLTAAEEGDGGPESETADPPSEDDIDLGSEEEIDENRLNIEVEALVRAHVATPVAGNVERRVENLMGVLLQIQPGKRRTFVRILNDLRAGAPVTKYKSQLVKSTRAEGDVWQWKPGKRDRNRLYLTFYGGRFYLLTGGGCKQSVSAQNKMILDAIRIWKNSIEYQSGSDS